MNEDKFNSKQFYQSYPRKVIARPGYPARAAFKSTFMFGLYGKRILREIGNIATYADIGGCFGFGANAMVFQIKKWQNNSPRTTVFEISSGFVKIGKVIFPQIEFVESKFDQWNGNNCRYDLITLFDVLEHVVNPELLLRNISMRSKYVMLITPMETSGELRVNKPPVNQGENHEDGHINFFTPRTYEQLLNTSDLAILESHLLPTIVPSGAQAVLVPEHLEPASLLYLLRQPKKLITQVIRDFPVVPWKLKRKILGGGVHACLCRSRSWYR